MRLPWRGRQREDEDPDQAVGPDHHDRGPLGRLWHALTYFDRGVEEAAQKQRRKEREKRVRTLLQQRRDATTRRRVVEKAQETWEARYVAPFLAWFEAGLPKTAPVGPGGPRHAVEAVHALARFYTEMEVWRMLGFDPPDAGALRDVIVLARNDLEILHRYLEDRYAREVRPWLPQPLTGEAEWRALRAAAQDFENGASDWRLWVGGLSGMMALALSWGGFHPR